MPCAQSSRAAIRVSAKAGVVCGHWGGICLLARRKQRRASRLSRVTDGEFHGPKDYLDLARSPDASASQLRELATSPYVFVRLAVAKHAATPSDVLSQLVPAESENFNDQEMLLALATHPRSPGELLGRIAQRIPAILHARDGQGGFGAGVALFKRDDTPEDVLFALIEHPEVTTEFRKVVARETQRESVLERLRADRSEKVRRAAQRGTL
jgi:hypothetical protein